MDLLQCPECAEDLSSPVGDSLVEVSPANLDKRRV